MLDEMDEIHRKSKKIIIDGNDSRLKLFLLVIAEW